jgi:hypothetical protein
MRTSRSLALVSLILSSALIAAACGGSDDKYAQDPSQQQGYPPQQQGYPPQQQGYPPQQGYPQQQPTTTAPASTAPAQPVIGIPCQADSGCGLNKCNLTTKVCAPCAGPADCQSGTCALGICVPGAAPAQ